MKSDSEGLHRIANVDDASRIADVIFVHGLGGSSHSTWRYGSETSAEHFFWPAELARDINVGVWSLGYPAGITAWGEPGMIIQLRAGNLAQKLANASIGKRPVIFITHSMGGLIVKSLIVSSRTLGDSDRLEIANATKGIVFCATPHRGSDFANAAQALGAFFGGSQKHVIQLKSAGQELNILHDEFVEWQRNSLVKVCSYAENIGLFKRRTLLRPLPLGLVVDRTSANPNIAGHAVRDVDDDHLTIVKPRNRNHDVYAGTLRFISGLLTPDQDPTQKATPEHSQISTQKIGKVLIADDHALVIEVLERLLHKNFKEIEVLTAKDGLEAIEQIKNNKPGLILLDLTMPRAHGGDVLSELSRTGANMPVIIYSGRSSADQQRDVGGIYKHTVGYLQKGADPSKVISLLASYINAQAANDAS